MGSDVVNARKLRDLKGNWYAASPMPRPKRR